jgi:hypothetical protein
MDLPIASPILYSDVPIILERLARQPPIDHRQRLLRLVVRHLGDMHRQRSHSIGARLSQEPDLTHSPYAPRL